MSQYDDYLDVHFSSGIFNRAYYLLATTPDWNAKKAFDVMVQANVNYWTSTTSFQAAACGVIKATRDYKYDVDAVVKAFSTVGLDTSSCK
jgi:pseudolysin